MKPFTTRGSIFLHRVFLKLFAKRVALMLAVLLSVSTLMGAAAPTTEAASVAANRPFNSPQQNESAKATVGFEIPVRGPGWRITNAPGTDLDHASQPNLHGIDLAPTSATSDRHLYAPFGGNAICYPKSQNRHGLGNVVYILHPNGYETNLGHLDDNQYCSSSNFTRNSDGTRTGHVNKGDVLGFVGNTGDSLGVHTHWQFQPIQGAWTSMPIYGIPGLRFFSNPRADGTFDHTNAQICYYTNWHGRTWYVCDYYGDAVWQSVATGPRVQILGGLNLSSTNVNRGQGISANVTVLNTGNQVVTINLQVGGRRGSNWGDPAANFDRRDNITIRPGDTYTYNAARSFDTSGGYFAETLIYINGQWGGINNLAEQWPRVNFTVR